MVLRQHLAQYTGPAASDDEKSMDQIGMNVPGRIRENWLTILRLGLATLVLCSHSIPLAYGKTAEAEHE